jgi:ABC-2 type transport system ATP-binding protein
MTAPALVPATPGRPAPGAPALTARGLVKRFGPLTAVDDLSLEVRTGEVLALLGPNGAGKTTTIDMLAGTTLPDHGEILWCGERRTPTALRRLVGLCAQAVEVWPHLTCREQLRYVAAMFGVPRAVAARRADELLDRVGLATKRDAQARTLSGGMQRRLHLVLALVHEPAVVVLDEPEAGLDPQSRVLVRELVADLATRCAVVLTSHDMAEVERVAHRIVIVDHGRAIAQGTARELVAGAGLPDVVELGTVRGSVAALAAAARDALAVDLVPAHNPAPAGTADRTRGGAPEIDGDVVRVRLHRGGPTLPGLLAALDHAGVPVTEVHARPATLEDLFLDLTGRAMRE